MNPPAAADPSFAPYLLSAIFLVVVAWVAMRWMSRTVKKDLDPANTGRMRASMAVKADLVAPTLVKEALAKGLVSAAQLATMSPIERQYLFNQIAPKLTGTTPMEEPQVPGAVAPASLGRASPPLSSVNLPLKPQTGAAPANAPQLRSTQAMTAIPGKPMELPPLTPEQLAALGSPPTARPASLRATPPGSPAVPARTPASVPPPHDPFADAPEVLLIFCPCCGMQLNLPAFAPFVSFCDQCGAKTAVRTEQQGRLVINTAPPGVTRRPVG